MDLKLIALILMAAFYIYAGVSHFRIPKFFIRITPPWVPNPELVNKIVGVVEIVLGVLLLIPVTTKSAAWGVIILLIVVFPANVYHFQKSLKKKKYVWQTLVRLPIQLLLLWWAWSYT